MGKKLLIFNWKENPKSSVQAKSLVRSVVTHARGKRAVIAPPAVFLEDIAVLLKKTKKSNVILGVQNVGIASSGAYTGEVPGAALKRYGVKYVIVGHSERRYVFGETDALVAKKIAYALKENLIPILCVGEKTRMSRQKAWNFIKNQLGKDLKFEGNRKLPAANLVVAYEPVWAIGGNKEVDPVHAKFIIGKIAGLIRESKTLNLKSFSVLYGGSVNCKNIGDFLQYKEIGGFLVGSASLKKDQIACLSDKILR